jgi:hypothetical protein
MYEDLEKNYLPKLKTMDEVIELLGKPDYGRKYWGLFKDKECFEYDLGGCVLFSAHSIALVCFNSNNSVVDYFRSVEDGMGEFLDIKELYNER